MLAQVKGIVRGNTVVVEDNDILDYDGEEAIVTLLHYAEEKTKQPFDVMQFAKPDKRVSRAEKKIDLSGYMGKGKKLVESDAVEAVRELRDNDRL